MITLLASVLVVAAFAVIVYRLAPRDGGRVAGLLERYRPHAPMADWSMPVRDERRQHADLIAAQSYRACDIESGVAAGTSGIRRRRIFHRAVQY